jgi:hypothetical protein
MESDDLDSDDGEVIVNCDQAAVAAQSVKPEINFPGDAYREPEDDKLLADVVEAEKRLTLPSKKPKSITIEHTGEECAYSSDEEEWEKPEPPSMPSLMIQLHDDDEKMKEAVQSKRTCTRRTSVVGTPINIDRFRLSAPSVSPLPSLRPRSRHGSRPCAHCSLEWTRALSDPVRLSQPD